jgi:hypothetical protein
VIPFKVKIAAITIFLILLLCVACNVLWVNPPPPCPMATLMIDKSLFPEEWFQQGPPDERNAALRVGIERLGVSFISMKHGVANEGVYRGRDIDDIKASYAEEVSSWFHTYEDETEWDVPAEFNYQSSMADRYRFGCQIRNLSGVRGVQSCQFVGQYGVYLVRFRADMSPIMTYNEFNTILQSIESKLAQCKALSQQD